MSRRVISISSCAGSGARRARRLRPWAHGNPGLWSPAVSRLHSRGRTLHRRTTTRRRGPVVAGLRADLATAPHGGGVLVIDDSGDRKDGTKTAHVGHQWLGRSAQTDNGLVPLPPPWADCRIYYPLH